MITNYWQATILCELRRYIGSSSGINLLVTSDGCQNILSKKNTEISVVLLNEEDINI